MSTCFVCGSQHVIAEPAHEKIADLWNKVGAVEAKLREFVKPDAVFPAVPSLEDRVQHLENATGANLTPDPSVQPDPAIGPRPVELPEPAPDVSPEQAQSPDPAPEQSDPQGT